MKGKIRFIKTVQKHSDGPKFMVGDEYEVNIHHIGVRGGFERYPSDNTMEGAIDPIIVCDIPSRRGALVCLELHFEVEVTVDQQISSGLVKIKEGGE